MGKTTGRALAARGKGTEGHIRLQEHHPQYTLQPDRSSKTTHEHQPQKTHHHCITLAPHLRSALNLLPRITLDPHAHIPIILVVPRVQPELIIYHATETEEKTDSRQFRRTVLHRGLGQGGGTLSSIFEGEVSKLKRDFSHRCFAFFFSIPILIGVCYIVYSFRNRSGIISSQRFLVD
jgi:hypothetical protein